MGPGVAIRIMTYWVNTKLARDQQIVESLHRVMPMKTSMYCHESIIHSRARRLLESMIRVRGATVRLFCIVAWISL